MNVFYIINKLGCLICFSKNHIIEFNFILLKKFRYVRVFKNIGARMVRAAKNFKRKHCQLDVKQASKEN